MKLISILKVKLNGIYQIEEIEDKDEITFAKIKLNPKLEKELQINSYICQCTGIMKLENDIFVYKFDIISKKQEDYWSNPYFTLSTDLNKGLKTIVDYFKIFDLN